MTETAAGHPIPNRVGRFAAAAAEAGWRVRQGHGADTGGAPFVTVYARRGMWEVRATWHTRHTGTYRLFTCIARSPRRTWFDTTLTEAAAMFNLPAGCPVDGDTTPTASGTGQEGGP